MNEEQRSTRRLQNEYTREEIIERIATMRFKYEKPKTLDYPEVQFAEDGKNGATVETTGAELRADLRDWFDEYELAQSRRNVPKPGEPNHKLCTWYRHGDT